MRVTPLLSAFFIMLAFSPPAHAGTQRFIVETEGDGLPVIYLPGLTSSPDVFREAAGSIDHEAHFVTVAGFGGVPAPDNLDPFISPLVEDLAAYLEAEDIEDAALVGHSMGGLVALLTAARSDRVAHVLVVDSVPCLPCLFQPQLTAEQAEAQRPMMRAQMNAMTDDQYIAVARQGLPRQARSENARTRVMADIERADIDAAKSAFVELMSTDYTARMEGLDVPVTVLVPYDAATGFDRQAVLARYEAQYALFPTVSLKVISDSRHFVMLDQPEAFRSELRLFISAAKD